MVSYLTIQVRLGSSRHFISIFIYNASTQLKKVSMWSRNKIDFFFAKKSFITLSNAKV